MSFINMYAVFFKKKNSTRFLDINVFKFKLLMVDVFGSIRQISRRHVTIRQQLPLEAKMVLLTNNPTLII